MSTRTQNTHVRTAETGMALSVTLAALVTLLITAMSKLGQLAGSAGGIDAPEPIGWNIIAAFSLVPLACCFVAFARTSGRFGAPKQLGRREATLYLGLAATILAALLVRAGTVGLETTLFVVALPPVLLFVAVRQNRAASRIAFDPTSLEAERALP